MAASKFELEEQLSDLNEAIRSGVLSTKDADGKEQRYRNLDQMIRARRDLELAISNTGNNKRRGRGMAIRTVRGVY